MATINHKKYDEATETFKDFYVYDGKETLIFKVDGEAGNVGIGTSSPSGKLHIKGNILIERSSIAESSELTMENGEFDIKASPYNYNVRFFTGSGGSSSERMRITPAGNVGIGTSSPTDTIGYGRALDIRSATGAVVYLRDSDAPTTQYGFLAFDGSDNGLKLHNANSSGFLRFDTNATERMRVTSAGNVGIGTSNPTELLQVEGNLKLAGIINVTGGDASIWVPNVGQALTIKANTGNVGIGTSSPDAKLDITASPSAYTGALRLGVETNSSEGDSVGISFKTKTALSGSVWENARIATITESVSSSVYGALAFSTMNATTLSEKMRITPTGVVELAQGQIKFPATQVASADPNTLDDYEEGTFTPTFAPTSGAFASISYSTQYGKYTKIGNRVDVNIQITASAVSVGTAGGVMSIGGLPFIVGAKPCPFSITLVLDWATGKFPVNGFFNDGAANCLLRYISSLNNNDIYVGGADITNTSSICLMGTYFV